MIKYILIGGRTYKSPDGGKAFCEEMIKDIAQRPVKILDCLFARDEKDWDERFKDDKDFFSKNLNDVEVELALPETFSEQVRNSDVVFFQGGIPRQLMAKLDLSVDWRKEFGGKVVAGSSGGADALVSYYGVGKTLNVGEGMGLVPVKLIPHWKSDDYAQGTDIDWEALLQKLKSYKEDLQIVTLGDTEFAVFTKSDEV